MGGMKVSNMDFIKLLPAFMQDDEAAIALSKAVNKLIGEPGRTFPSLIQPQTGCIAPSLFTINLDSQFHHTSPCELFCSKL